MINLLSPQRLVNMKTARTNTVLLLYIRLAILSVLIIGVIIAGSYYFLDLQHKRATETVELDKERVAELESYHVEAQQLSSTVNAIAAVMSEEFIFSDMLKHIGTLMPRGAALTGLELSAENLEAPLVVRAQIDTEQRAIVLLNNLEQSDMFERAQVRTIQMIEDEEETSSRSSSRERSDNAHRYRYVATLDVYMKQSETKK